MIIPLTTENISRLILQNIKNKKINYFKFNIIGSSYSKELKNNKFNYLIASFLLKQVSNSKLKLISSKFSIANFNIRKNEKYGFKFISSHKKLCFFFNTMSYYTMHNILCLLYLSKTNVTHPSSSLFYNIKLSDYFSSFKLTTGYQLVFQIR